MAKVGRLFDKAPDVRSVESSELFKFDGLYGIEIELERMRNASELEMKYWRLVNDGSLRNHGIEFVLTQPLGGADIPRALSELEKAILKGRFDPSLTDRTSVHVHMDVRELSNTELSKLIILYTIFERVLFQYAGPHRWGNIFCMPIEYAQLQIPILTDIPENDGHLFADAVFSGSRGIDRYSALNLLALPRFGSLEFRMHQGEWRAEQLLRWVSILACLKEEARSSDEIPDIHTNISSNGPLGYLRKVFGSYAHHLEYDDAVNDIMNGVRLSQDILYHHRMIEEQNKQNPRVRPSQHSRIFKEFLEKHRPSANSGSDFDVYSIDPLVVRHALGINRATYESIVESGRLEDEVLVSRIGSYMEAHPEVVGEPTVREGPTPRPSHLRSRATTTSGNSTRPSDLANDLERMRADLDSFQAVRGILLTDLTRTSNTTEGDND
ncbi:MAG: hypothetical protein GWO28_01230 [candidate division Zixibacteria bacterium]|nr:hypothetical protein [candidate division Zixibacteria bacterium]